MFDLIARLQQKSERVRQGIAFWSAAAVTGTIALVWVVSLLALHTSDTGSADTAAAGTSIPGSEQFQNIGESAAGFYEEFKSNISQLRGGVSTETSADAEGSVEQIDASTNDSASAEVESTLQPSPTWTTQ